MTTERQTVAGAYAKIEGHEELCAVRYAGINGKLNILMTGAVGLIFSLLGWMAFQLYTLEPLRIEAAQHNSSTTVNVAQPTKPAP